MAAPAQLCALTRPPWAAARLLVLCAAAAQPPAAALLQAAVLRALLLLVMGSGARRRQAWRPGRGAGLQLGPRQGLLLAPLALLALPALLEPPALLELLQELLLLPPLLLLACHGCPCKWNSRSRCDEQIAALVEGGPSCTAPPPCSPALLRERQGRPQLGGDLLDVLWRGQHDVACERLRG